MVLVFVLGLHVSRQALEGGEAGESKNCDKETEISSDLALQI